MITKKVSHYLAKLIKQLPPDQKEQLRKAYDVAEKDDDLKAWLDIPLEKEDFEEEEV